MIKLRQLWQKLRSSFWFVPGLLSIGAVGLAFIFIAAETAIDQRYLERWPLLLGASAEGARGLLTTVATSMITVAGVVFSITLVALTLASSQYTSRVLRNFMRDRFNQVVLGVFVGIFAYCLVVLRTIRGGEENAFAPSLAVLFGLVLALVGIMVLIYFIHHIAISIQASHILASAADETLRAIDHFFPDELGQEEGKEETAPELDRPGQVWFPVLAVETGYIQSVEIEALLRFAREQQTVVRMERGIGEFLIEGTPLASVLSEKAPDKESIRKLQSVYAVGRQRSVEQDTAFGIRQIVDMALKALSPGINETTTAVMCINYLTAILVHLTERRIESQYRSEDGELRVLSRGPTYASLVSASFDQIRQNADGNVIVVLHLLESLEQLAHCTSNPIRRQVLLAHARAVAEVGQRTVAAPVDRQHIDAQSTRVIQLLDTDHSRSTYPPLPRKRQK